MLAGWGRPRCPQCHVSTGVPGGRYRDGPQRLVGGDIVTAWPILQPWQTDLHNRRRRYAKS